MISKPNNKAPKVHFVIHSNERTTPLVGLSLKYFEKYIGLDNINISVLSNKFLTDNLPYKDKVNYISGDVDFNDGGYHFGPTLTKAYNQIQEEYVFFFCEDYILTNNINFDTLTKLVALMDGEKVDLFSFASNQPEPNNFIKYENSTNYGFKEDEIYYIRKGFLYEYSVQPCLWRRSSILELLKYNPNVSLHHLDTSHIKGKTGTYRTIDISKGYQEYVGWNEEDKYNFKTLCSKYMIFDYYPQAGQQFVITYIEIIRAGKITLPGTPGPVLANDNWVQQKIFQLIDENGLRNNSEFDRYFYNK
jgi:hypothetical protein